jgi:(p)ppGpp synthase/HD superfamily hydrolase
MITIEDVLKNMKAARTSQREAQIKSAYEFAAKAHAGQKRKSGEDYIQHSLHTALNIARLGLGSKTIAAGLLHDVPEDTAVTLKEVEGAFGSEIAFLVDGVTKVGKIRLREEKEEIYLENMRKMFLAMAADIRVVIIKLADRLHNMETLDALPEEKRQRIAMETLEVFAPPGRPGLQTSRSEKLRIRQDFVREGIRTAQKKPRNDSGRTEERTGPRKYQGAGHLRPSQTSLSPVPKTPTLRDGHQQDL